MKNRSKSDGDGEKIGFADESFPIDELYGIVQQIRTFPVSISIGIACFY
ncbi:MAG: hypothetical protein ACKPH7_06395 [Planktothrix sp.]